MAWKLRNIAGKMGPLGPFPGIGMNMFAKKKGMFADGQMRIQPRPPVTTAQANPKKKNQVTKSLNNRGVGTKKGRK